VQFGACLRKKNWGGLGPLVWEEIENGPTVHKPNCYQIIKKTRALRCIVTNLLTSTNDHMIRPHVSCPDAMLSCGSPVKMSHHEVFLEVQVGVQGLDRVCSSFCRSYKRSELSWPVTSETASLCKFLRSFSTIVFTDKSIKKSPDVQIEQPKIKLETIDLIHSRY
jgi:hypothetical protein